MDDLRLFIDALLVKPKRVAGSVDWRPTEREGQMRLQAPLIIDDEISRWSWWWMHILEVRP
jgi:hypothetical protein